jgi:hypothetical protein
VCSSDLALLTTEYRRWETGKAGIL